MAAEASEVQAAAQSAQPSPTERLKSILSAPSNDTDAGTPSPSTGAEKVQTRPSSGETADGADDKPVPAEAEAEEDRGQSSDDEASEDAQSEERQFSNLTELLEAGGLDSDKGYELEVPVKIDGKEGTAKLRDLVKSYQLDGHINQKLESANQAAKALEAKQHEFEIERADKILQLDAGLQTLTKVLFGKYEGIDWNKLAQEDPAAAQTKYFEYAQDKAYLEDIGKSIAAEKQAAQQKQDQALAAWVAEQRSLVLAKTPEWANEATRVKEWAELGAYLESEGFSKEEFQRTVDHRQVLVARKAQKWDQLQKSKPALLNKVKAAPKLLKPGSPQSKAVLDTVRTNKARDRFRQTGRVSDGAAVLKGMLQ